MGNSQELEEEKRALRRQIRSWLGDRSQAELRRGSEAIVTRLRCRLERAPRQRLMAFVALPTEPDLSGLWSIQKRLVLPKVCGETLSLWLVADPSELLRGYRGILEPDERRCERVELSTVELILVPGLAFGAGDGSRLGRGGGFYDRLLGGTVAPRWGICFEGQVREGVPCGDHDARMDAVITCERELDFPRR